MTFKALFSSDADMLTVLHTDEEKSNEKIAANKQKKRKRKEKVNTKH